MKKVKTPAEKTLNKMGFKTLPLRHKNTNGPDIYAIKGERVYTVEVKTTRRLKGGSFQTEPVCKARRNDDLVAIEFDSGYVLVEPMRDHLKACSKKGYRSITELC